MCTGNRERMEQTLARSSSRGMPFGANAPEPELPIPQSTLPSNPMKEVTPETNPLKYPTPKGNPLKEPTPDATPLKEPDLPLPKNFREVQEQTQMVKSSLKDFQQEFVKKVRPAAEKVAKALNVPASAIIAQLAYESGWGKSSLAAQHNNFGGLKAGSAWKGSTVKLPTKEKNQTESEVASFRSYGSPEEYAQDMISFLQKPRYKSVPGAKDPYQYALRLGLAGYHQDTPGVYASEIRRIAQQIDGGVV